MSDDASLMLRVTQGDRQAFLNLYDRHSARVYGLSLYMLRDSMTAEEITQDAFLRLWTKAESFDPERGSLLTWLLTITRRLALDRIRLESRRPQIQEIGEGPDWTHIADPGSESDEFRWQTVRMAMADLPEDQRLTIEYAYYHGLSQSQIAEHLGVPLGTVKTRIRLGMSKLRDALLDPTPMTTERSETGSKDV